MVARLPIRQTATKISPMSWSSRMHTGTENISLAGILFRIEINFNYLKNLQTTYATNQIGTAADRHGNVREIFGFTASKPAGLWSIVRRILM